MTRLRRATAAAVGASLSIVVLAACSDSGSGGSDTAASEPSGQGSATLDALYEGNEGTPPSTSPPAAKDKEVWWISCGQVSSACSTYAAAGQEAAEAIGWDFHIADGNLNIANGEATALKTAIAANPDAIVLDAFGCTGVQPQLQQAKAAGIPVLGLSNTDCSDAGTGPSLFTVPMVYSDTVPGHKEFWTSWGDWSARYVSADSGGDAKIIAAFGEGDPQFDFLKEGFESGLEAECPNCEVVEVPWTLADLAPNGPWVTALRNALIQNPDADYVWFPFDFNAVESGGAKVVLQSGSKAKVISNTGLNGALDMVRSGQMYAEAVSFDVDWPSWAAIDQLNRHFNDEDSVPQGLGFVAVDKDHNLPAESGQNFQSQVDFRSMYQEAWGVG
jgi:ribose transport system substrate-binding protein